ncbi:MAG: hypothetical protein ABII82_13660 [Verrucomicrobiota bacterium]
MGMKWMRRGFPWVVAAVPVASVLMLAGLALRLPGLNGPRETVNARPELRVTSLDASRDTAMSERLKLLDPTPLFLPSPLSSSRLEYPWNDAESKDSILQDYDPRLVAADWYLPQAAGQRNGRPVSVAMDVIGPGEVRMPFQGMARATQEMRKLPERWAFVVVYSVKQQAPVGEFRLPSPGAVGFVDTMWSPMELLLVSEADGMVGDPELLSGSGVSEVDDYVLDTIQSTFAMGGDLLPGVYRLVIGQ